MEYVRSGTDDDHTWKCVFDLDDKRTKISSASFSSKRKAKQDASRLYLDYLDKQILLLEMEQTFSGKVTTNKYSDAAVKIISTDIYAINQFSDTVDKILSVDIQKLVETRDAARANLDYNTADQIRNDLWKTYRVAVDDISRTWSAGGNFGPNGTFRWTDDGPINPRSFPPSNGIKPPPSNGIKSPPPQSPATVRSVATTTITTPTPSRNDDESTEPSLLPPLPANVQVAIAGGGLGGLAVCAALRARGVDAHIFESSPTFVGRGSTGTGIMISRNGWTALEAIEGTEGEDEGAGSGLVGDMRRYASKIMKQTITKTDPSGSVDATISMNSTHQYNIGWTRAHEVLLEKVPPEVIHYNCHFQSYHSTQDGEGDSNSVNISFRDGRTVRTSLLIGADGAGSAVRRFMAQGNHAQDQTAAASSYETRYSGQILWNAILPTADILPADKGDAPVHKAGEVEYTLCGNNGQVILAFDAGENQTSWYLTLMEHDVHSTNNDDNTKHDPTALAEIQTALQSPNFGGFGRAGVRSQLLRLFAPWPSATRLLHSTPEDQIFERRLADRPPLTQWTDATDCTGHVVLIGDAAHPMVPSQGQGTMVTWEDAADLAICVAPCVLEEGEGLRLAVERFVGRRAKRCARVQRFSAVRYMGAELPTFKPWKILYFLWMKRNMNFIMNGYEPIEEGTSTERRVTKRSRVLKFFGLGSALSK